MFNQIKKCTAKTEVRFVIVGVFNTLVGLVAYPVFYYILDNYKIGYIYILCVSTFFCVNFSYITNSIFVFKYVQKNIVTYLKYNTFQLVIIFINFIYLPLFVSYFKFNPVVAQTIYVLFTTVISYVWHLRVTFRQ